MKKKDLKVLSYFEKTAREFDSIYEKTPNFLKKTLNKLFRKGMYERAIFTLKECDRNINTVLDVGCGSGRIAVPLAEKGIRVTGIDYSKEMIKLAGDHQKIIEKKYGKPLPIRWIYGNFSKDFTHNGSFDAVIALGLFDYIKDPVPYLKKMKNLAKQKIIASFPARYVLQMPIRKIWLLKRKCPVYFYTRKKIRKLLALARINQYIIQKVPAGYMVIVMIQKKNSQSNSET